METLRRGMSVFTAFSFVVYFVMGQVTIATQVSAKEKPKDYIICTVNEEQVKEIEKTHTSSGEINGNGEGLLQENEMTSVQMTEKEAEKLAGESGVRFVEEDVIVEASTKTSRYGKEKKEKKIKENKSEKEWNIRMIRSDKVKKKNKESQKVKIAVLDSGVDFGNDIDVEKTITLVPGEDEMSPLFMDGTGHGNSVAGLIAATDNGEGITGVNPNAEIYSIRVLDDENCAPVSRVVEAIYQAIDWKVNIINMSFGVSEYSAALEKAIQAAHKAGILVIAAAGNTGDAGVQYPAAFDEVMAVGSVDKHGDIVESSAKGEEVEIVAPGELVRSTGVLGDQRVDSGTSLAAPQVAAVASLIWEKDLSVSADFVRELLKESANAYGQETSYGSGLVDAAYALENYDTFKKQYKEKADTAELEENEEAVLNFEETNCVKGSWDKDDHGKLVPSKYSNVQKGARFSDNNARVYEEEKNSKGESLSYFSGMTRNPWWHGYWKKMNSNKVTEYTSNYVACYIYISRLANKKRYGGTATVPSGMLNNVKNAILSDIDKIDWENEYGEEPSTAKKRAFMWGMAIHALADSFAHSAYKEDNGVYRPITHGDGKITGADNTKQVEQRYNHAREAVELAMKKYVSSDHPSGTYREFDPAKKATGYKMRDMYKYVKDVEGADKANAFRNCSYSPSNGTK